MLAIVAFANQWNGHELQPVFNSGVEKIVVAFWVTKGESVGLEEKSEKRFRGGCSHVLPNGAASLFEGGRIHLGIRGALAGANLGQSFNYYLFF